jgi:site-specific DNA-methyltransferase (adenine-specific)
LGYIRDMKKIEAIIKSGDCLDVLKDYPDNFFNLIVTSPPYADCREKSYGGTKPDKNMYLGFYPVAKNFYVF